MKLALVMPFRDIRFLVVVPKREAIPLNESPAATVYVVPGALGAALGAAAAGAAAGAPVPETVNTCPIRMALALVIAFRLIRFLVVVPNLEAIPLKVSLATTV
jgi:hypothetical protein